MGVPPRLALLALALLLLPALVTGLFLASRGAGAVEDGAQPGGRVRGVLLASATHGASVAGVEVELRAVSPDGRAVPLATGRADADGRFEIQAVPCLGHYELQAGGVEWVRTARALSLRSDPGEVELELEPAARLRVAFRRGAGPPVSAVAWRLVQGARGSWFSRRRPEVALAGRVSGPELVVEGLAPGRARLEARLDRGEVVELVLDLRAAWNEHRIDL